MNSIPQGPDLVLDELPGGTGQLVHAPDAGQVFAVNALGGGMELFSPIKTADTWIPLRRRSRTSAAVSSTP